MKIFLEIAGSNDEFVRRDVTDLSIDEIVALRDEIVALVKMDNYQSRIHTCYHDEGGSRRCKIRVIE